METRRTRIEGEMLELLVELQFDDYIKQERVLAWKKVDSLLRLYIEMNNNEIKEN